MSFDDYANHIYQKHRLAVALAIIKSKPPNLTTVDYLDQLKSIVDYKMDNDNVTVCSDDFLMDDVDDDMNDSVTILKDFDPGYIAGEVGYKDVGEDRIGERLASEKSPTIPNESTKTTFYDSSQTQYTADIDNAITDITIYEEYHNVDQNLNTEQSSVQNIVREYEKINDTSKSNQNTINTSKLHPDNRKTNAEIDDFNKINVNYESDIQNMDLTYYDSQKTVLYTVHGFTQNYTHYSPSQSDIIIPSKYIHGINGNRGKYITQNEGRNEEKNIDNNSEVIYSENIDEESNKTKLVSTENNFSSKIYENPSNHKDVEYSHTVNMFSRNNDEGFKQILNAGNQNCSFNNETDLIINNINTKDNNSNEHNTLKNTTTQQLTQNSQNIDAYFESMQEVKQADNRRVTNYEHNYSKCNDMHTVNKTVDYNQYNNNKNELEQQNIEKNIQSEHDITHNKTNTIPGLTTVTQVLNLTQNYNDNEEETTEDSQEIISYKVLGEFNKLKTYLNRTNRRMSSDGYSTDSGYRSDSQIRGSNRSALQLSGNWLNQSGCSLYNYIIQCPLVASTRDITNEIAEVLGQLVDRLHEEENYPSFLEDILETIDLLLLDVYEGVSSGDSQFLKKDESIQRILLLSKSIHIQQHCIEKISNILESFHTKITENDVTYELSNINRVENISYIFHILEILLKKYLKNRDVLSQSSTQLPQDEDKVFKRSSITDIWRKKWNPSQKVFEGSREKKCVLKKCSAILNKIVVDCVNSYSLVAYSALKCFNSMQS